LYIEQQVDQSQRISDESGQDEMLVPEMTDYTQSEQCLCICQTGCAYLLDKNIPW